MPSSPNPGSPRNRLNPPDALRYDSEVDGDSPSIHDREPGIVEMDAKDLETAANPPSCSQNSSSQQSSNSEPSPRRPNRGEETPSERADRIERIKAAIDAGEYETPEKLDAALHRLFGELNMDDEDDDGAIIS